MEPKVSIAFYISHPGSHHVSHAAAVMHEIQCKWPFIHFEIFGTSSERFLELNPEISYRFHPVETDKGTPLYSAGVNAERTAGAPARSLRPSGFELEVMAAKIRQFDCLAMLCDHCAEGPVVGSKAGVTTIVVEDFVRGLICCHDWCGRDNGMRLRSKGMEEGCGSVGMSGPELVAGYVCRIIAEAEEILAVVDPDGKMVGAAPRSMVHGNNQWLHCVVHILVFDENERLLLQRRSMNKSVAPGKWDTSVGGHVDCGETTEDAVFRETAEELGIMPESLQFAYSYIHSNDYESELVSTFICRCSGPFSYNPEEIDAVKFWTRNEIEDHIGSGLLSDNFEDEFNRYLEWTANI